MLAGLQGQMWTVSETVRGFDDRVSGSELGQRKTSELLANLTSRLEAVEGAVSRPGSSIGEPAEELAAAPHSSTRSPPSSSKSVPNAIIVGGLSVFPTKLPDTEIKKISVKIVENIPRATQSQIRMPYASSTRGNKGFLL